MYFPGWESRRWNFAQYSILAGHYDLAFLLVKSYPEWDHNSAGLLSLAVVVGSLELVENLLGLDYVDLTWNEPLPGLVEAIFADRLDIFKVIMADPRCDPSNPNDWGLDFIQNLWEGGDPQLNIYYACQLNRIEMVRMLLRDPRVRLDSPLEDVRTGPMPLQVASEMGHLEVVQMLLLDPRNPDPSVDDNKAIRLAIKNNHQDVVDLLMQDSRVSSSFTQ